MVNHSVQQQDLSLKAVPGAIENYAGSSLTILLVNICVYALYLTKSVPCILPDICEIKSIALPK